MNDNLPIKDKMAVILHGIVGGMDSHNGVGAPTNIADCAKTIKYNVLTACECDVFAHSWSITHEEEIKSLYNPVMSLFQPQEFFHYTGKQISEHPTEGQGYRCTSRYVSLNRALELKRQYEKNNNFKYKWVCIVRYDLVFYNKLDLSRYNNDYLYVCSEPHWGGSKYIIDDRVFLGNSFLTDELSKMGGEICLGIYDASDIHRAISIKLSNMFNGNMEMVQFGFDRYKDVEVYRVIIKPELNPVGHAYGALETKGRLEELLKKIENEYN